MRRGIQHTCVMLPLRTANEPAWSLQYRGTESYAPSNVSLYGNANAAGGGGGGWLPWAAVVMVDTVIMVSGGMVSTNVPVASTITVPANTNMALALVVHCCSTAPGLLNPTVRKATVCSVALMPLHRRHAPSNVDITSVQLAVDGSTSVV